MIANHFRIAQPSYNRIEIENTCLQLITLLKITRFLDINFITTQQNTDNKEESFVVLNAMKITNTLNSLKQANQQIQEKWDKLLNLLDKKQIKIVLLY